MSSIPPSLTHEWIWQAIDALARHKGLSPSGLARLAGLDPTTFNRSKRFTAEGRPRWPSTESISKILSATGVTLDEFTILASEEERARSAALSANVPLIGQITNELVGGWHEFADAGAAGLDAHSSLVAGGGGSFAVEVADSSLEPIYRCGLTLIASAGPRANPGDRVLIKPHNQRPVVRLLVGATSRRVEVASLIADERRDEIERADIDWIARIIWTSK